jgi:hypothetical protein
MEEHLAESKEEEEQSVEFVEDQYLVESKEEHLVESKDKEYFDCSNQKHQEDHEDHDEITRVLNFLLTDNSYEPIRAAMAHDCFGHLSSKSPIHSYSAC